MTLKRLVEEEENAIENFPAVDAVPVVHGHWEEKEVIINGGNGVITEWQSCRCSVCGKYVTAPYMYYFHEFNYCNECGAKMDEVTE